MKLVVLFLFGLGFSSAQDRPEPDPLTVLGVSATKGAAAGYVPDKACATCHPQLYQSYQAVGMAQSFAKPQHAAAIEDFGKEYFHQASQRYYRIDRQDGRLTFRRYQRDKQGKPINEFATAIDWVMGSGNRARSYLFQTQWGQLYELPLGWYSEGNRWGMSPGFEGKRHMGLARQVKRECMFCHNAFPEIAEGQDAHGEPHLFPKDLPEGTGCQRCHGPGADHIRAAISGTSLADIHAKIVNPVKLPPRERDSVCFQCHLLPSVSFVGARQLNRPTYSFRPGQDLSDYVVHVEVTNAQVKPEDHFEINHHGYRFWQSACFQKSEGALACISCHDPHVKPTSQDFRRKVAKVCSDCHATELQSHQPSLAEGADCAGCHMPTRRTQDVVLATMTDHRIARGPFDHKALVKPLEPVAPILTNIALLPWGKSPGADAALYQVLPVVRTKPYAEAVNALERVLSTRQQHSTIPALDLAEGQIKVGRLAAAQATSEAVLQHAPKLARAHELLGMTQLLQGRRQQAIEAFETALSLQPTPSIHHNLAVALSAKKQNALALQHLDAAISLQPFGYGAWRTKGKILAQSGQLAKARMVLKRALELEPGDAKTYELMIAVLRRLGQKAEADRYLEVGLRVAWNPTGLRSLQQPTSNPTPQNKQSPRP